MAVKYQVVVLFDNQQSAHIAAQRISEEIGVAVDVLSLDQIATYLPKVEGVPNLEPLVYKHEDKKG